MAVLRPPQAAARGSPALTSLQGCARPSTRFSTTSASETDDRKTWICWPSSSHRSWVTQRAPGLGAALGAAGLAAGGGDRLVHRHDDVGDAQLVRRAAPGDSRRRGRARWSPARRAAAWRRAVPDRTAKCPGAAAISASDTGLARAGLVACRPDRPSPSRHNVLWCSAACQISFAKRRFSLLFRGPARCKKRGPPAGTPGFCQRDIDFPSSLVKYSRSHCRAYSIST